MARTIWVPLYYWQYDEESGDLLDTDGIFYWYTTVASGIGSSHQAIFWNNSTLAAYDLVSGTAALNTLANVPQSAGTVMFYYRLDFASTTTLFRATADDFDTGIQIDCTSGTQVVVQKGTTAVNDTISISGLSGSRWYHVAYSWDDVANEHRLIVYDTVTTTANDTGVQTQNQTQPVCEYFSLQTTPPSFHVFSSLKVYDTVLTPAEIATERDDFPTPTPEAKPYSEPTLLARYKLFTSAEESLSETSATVAGDIQFRQPDKPTSNNAVASTRYNETSTNGDIQHNPPPSRMEDFTLLRGTIMFWAKVDFDWDVNGTYQLATVNFPTTPKSEMLITFNPNSINPSISFEIETGVSGGSYTYSKSITTFSSTTDWAHYCLTWDIETHAVILYQYDGGVLNTFTYLDWDGTTPKGADADKVGVGTLAGSQNYKGWLCDMKFFYDALTPAEITVERYNFSTIQTLQDYILSTDIEGDTLVDRNLLPATQNSLNTQRITIYQEDGRTPLDLSDGDGATTVTGWIKPYEEDDKAITGTLSVVSGSEDEGLVDWTYSASDTEDAGEMWVQFKVVNTDSTSGFTYITPPRYWNVYRDYSD